MSINDDILYKVDSEIGKDKKVVELQKEIDRLNQEIIGLNNCIIEFHSEFCNKQAEINRLNNIINELEKWAIFFNENGLVIDLEEGKQTTVMPTLAVIEKLQELKGEDKE